MSVYYTVKSKRPGLSKGEKPKYYPVVTGRRVANLREVCEDIASRSSLHQADVMAVVHSFIDLVPELLQDGKTVRLDGFGTFNLHASGVGKENPDKVTSRDITGVRMSFLPDKRIKNLLLKTTKFVKKR